ncbi:hypothetical protein GGS23DRAFT_287542 [Durotheca rogersii]|uniref:uncharacterized protein n=1 Tax=Durotheca rogersii TaxID=419775 RepID=UPI002220BE93|nr:uncharacterized protein GGS23DRAFT_287542 [Durotheca rogersii]KAI5866762.1 hypothetical protein GGS23DRAFT_287542 [Durotheca rogersii]
MSSCGLSPRDEAYMPPVPSPLNPSSPETSPRRYRRGDRYRPTFKRGGTELSPTQILMRQKAAEAWKLMATHITNKYRYVGTKQGEAPQTNPAGPAKQQPIRTTAEYGIVPNSTEKGRGAGVNRQDVDVEKQALVDDDYYRAHKTPGINLLSHLLTTRRWRVTVGVVCVVGFLSAVRAIGSIHTWRI